MHIAEKIVVDDTGRLLLTKVFDEVPEKVIPLFDTKTKRLFFSEVASDDDPKLARKVDNRNRVCLPKKLIEELGKEYYLCVESTNEHFVLPCKFLFIG